MIQRVLAITRKEIFHILRDPFTLAMALGLPVFMVTLFGFAIEFNVRDMVISVTDTDRTYSSRQLTETFSSSGYFYVRHRGNVATAIHDLDADRARAILVIEPDFEKDYEAGRSAEAQILLDGSDNSTAGVIAGYLAGIQRSAIHKLQNDSGTLLPLTPASVLKTRFLFNSELNSRWFVVPGLAVVVISILSILLTALTVAKEWENGSMELLLSTPVRPIEIILGKIAPYTVLSLVGIAFVYVAARTIFEVPFRGSHFLFLIGSLIFLIAYLAQGMLISVLTRKQQLSMQFALISGLLPSMLLSGFIFPIESMPVFFQYFTSLLPAKWFMIISRSIFLKGSGLEELVIPFAALLFLSSVMVFISAIKFKKDLEP